MEIQDLSVLEEKIEKLLQVVNRLRAEREELQLRLQEKEAEVSRLREELNRREEERRAVKERIEHLISRLSQFSEEGA
ncbi:cell division protein ZapB [Thermosulfurimonas marina]|uniref:Cell division protein ZapB n=1 Tax=Thermosulfurimonas marina TaxID=2047767 RepID=A0A6H1WTQ2_9BACT|nr:cell division protein ZapB [Thermosulfurimonas marina]QJA06496.1 cell division protein ZapB [Thermosulfurimonas marina]